MSTSGSLHVGAGVFKILVDTCVWLDLAKDGTDAPFIVCDPRCDNTPETVRSRQPSQRSGRI